MDYNWVNDDDYKGTCNALPVAMTSNFFKGLAVLFWIAGGCE